MQSQSGVLSRAFIPRERVDSEQRALDGRERGAAFGFCFFFWASAKRASQEAVASTVDEPGLVSTHLDTAVAVRIESVANRGRIGCIHSKPAFVPAPIAGQPSRGARSAGI